MESFLRVYKGYKIRIYPTKDQIESLNRHIGHCRFIWNHMLETQIKRFENKEKYLKCFDMNKLITGLKKEHPWLADVSIHSLHIKGCWKVFQSDRNLKANEKQNLALQLEMKEGPFISRMV